MKIIFADLFDFRALLDQEIDFVIPGFAPVEDVFILAFEVEEGEVFGELRHVVAETVGDGVDQAVVDEVVGRGAPEPVIKRVSQFFHGAGRRALYVTIGSVFLCHPFRYIF